MAKNNLGDLLDLDWLHLQDSHISSALETGGSVPQTEPSTPEVSTSPTMLSCGASGETLSTPSVCNGNTSAEHVLAKAEEA